jgi:hypothetical protein
VLEHGGLPLALNLCGPGVDEQGQKVDLDQGGQPGWRRHLYMRDGDSRNGDSPREKNMRNICTRGEEEEL